MAANISMHSMDSDVFFVEQLSNEPSPQGNNSPNILNSTELSGSHARETPPNSSVASPEPDIATLDNDSKDSTFAHGFRAQQPIVPPCLNDLSLAPNPFQILETMALINNGHDDNFSLRHRNHLTHRPSQLHPRT